MVVLSETAMLRFTYPRVGAALTRNLVRLDVQCLVIERKRKKKEGQKEPLGCLLGLATELSMFRWFDYQRSRYEPLSRRRAIISAFPPHKAE